VYWLNGTWAFPWTASEAVNQWTAGSLPYVNTSAEVLYTGSASYVSNGTYSAIFDVIQSTYLSETTQVIPVPGAGGKVSGTLAEDGKSGTATWTVTGNQNDNYQVYWATGLGVKVNDGQGHFLSTACAVRKWLHPITSNDYANGAVTVSGNTVTQKVTSLNPRTTLTVVLIVNRPGGYSAAYNSFVFNNAFVMSPNVILSAVAFIVAIGFMI